MPKLYHLISVFMSLCSEWTDQRQLLLDSRANFRASNRGRAVPLPDHLAEPFPKFARWLYNHVRVLKEEGFPISSELECLSCMPSEHVTSYDAMWAFGAHLVTSQETGTDYVTFDSGIAAIPPDQDSSSIDVGILRDIILVCYGEISCVLLEGSWIKSRDQGRAVIKRDQYGFWTVLFNARDAENQNPYVYPASITQVFFMDDSRSPEWKVVLRHDPRARRIVTDREQVEFSAPGTCASNARPGSTAEVGEEDLRRDVQDEEVPIDQYNTVAAQMEDASDERHLDDTQFEDEFEIVYVE